jgi:glycine/D-amino acid oxidase-like deaminating enzyme
MKHVTKQHLGIAGAGLVGRVLALKLLAQGHRVTLFEKDSDESENAAGRVAAGMLAPFAELETAESDIFDLGQRSIQIWPGLLEQLGIPDALQQAGSVITAHPADMAELERFMAQLRAKAKSPDAAESIQALDPNALQQLEPDLSHHSRGFFLPSEGQVNAQRFMDRSRSYLREHPEVICEPLRIRLGVRYPWTRCQKRRHRLARRTRRSLLVGCSRCQTDPTGAFDAPALPHLHRTAPVRRYAEPLRHRRHRNRKRGHEPHVGTFQFGTAVGGL